MIVVNPVFWILVFCAAFVLWLACGRLFHKIGGRAIPAQDVQTCIRDTLEAFGITTK